MKKYTLIIASLILSANFAYCQWTTSGTNIYNTNTGNVGIGITTPYTRLNVYSEGAKSQVTIGKVATGFSCLYVGTSGDTGGYGDIQMIKNEGTLYGDLFLNKNGGNVGIGTTDTKGYRLAIAGKMIAEEAVVKLQANWPDYVFDLNYHLNPLKELDQYIKINKHLPDVPSASEVQEKGINIGEMNATLLKKVEELTLYVIAQEKKINALQCEIETLKK